MADKVISEFKVIETDDGYRIELKGDKEQMKKWFEHGGGFGPGMGFGRHGGPGRWMRGFFGGRHHGPWGHGWHDVDDEEAPEGRDQPRA